MGAFADKIRAKAREVAGKPMTPTGASSAMAKQAAVSSTGKAAVPGAGAAQSAVQETVVAEQAEAQQGAIAEGVQEAGEAMAVTEQAADVKQQGAESNLAAKKLQADNDFNNQLKQFSSRVEMAETKQEQDLLSIEMKGQLSQQRLNNKKYTEALQGAGKRSRLESKEDFAIAISEKDMARGKLEGDSDVKRKSMIEDYSRDNNQATNLAEIAAALEKSVSDSEAEATAAQVEMVSGMAKEGINMGMSANAASNAQQNDLALAEEGSLSEAQYNQKHGAGSYKNDNLEYQMDKPAKKPSNIPGSGDTFA